MLMQVQQNSFTHVRVLLVLTDGGILAFRRHFGGILAAFWRHFGGILAAFWRHFGPM
jgi:hypothetical protein